MTENRKTPKLRFKGFTDAWEQRKLGDVYRKCTEKMMVLTIQIQLSLSRECPIARRLGLPNSPT